MQREEKISVDDLHSLIESIFADGHIEIYEAYSKFGESIKTFRSYEEISKFTIEAISTEEKFLNFSIYNPETKGHVVTTKIELEPEKCNGQNFRFRVTGWGLIHLQITIESKTHVKCRLAVNSEKRASNLEETCPDLKSPSLWDWKLVDKNARRFIRELRKYA